MAWKLIQMASFVRSPTSHVWRSKLTTSSFADHGNIEQNAVSLFNPKNGSDTLFVRDPKINWVSSIERTSVEACNIC